MLVTQIITCHFYPYPSLDIGSLLLIRSHFLISKHCKDRSFLGVKSVLHTQERPILMSFCRSLMVLFSLTTYFSKHKTCSRDTPLHKNLVKIIYKKHEQKYRANSALDTPVVFHWNWQKNSACLLMYDDALLNYRNSNQSNYFL